MFRIPDEALLIAAATVVVVVLFGAWRLWRQYIHKDRTTRRVILAATALYFIITIVLYLPSVGAVEGNIISRETLWLWGTGMLLSPLGLAQHILPVLIALWLVWRVRPLRANEQRDQVDLNNTYSVEDTVRRVFTSDEFATALRTSLPTGGKDKQYGLDYIPFMLDALRAKRRRFDRRASIFFWVTIGVGMIFAGIVVIFGYTLVNERAVGLPRDVVDLREIATDLNTTLIQTDKSLIKSLPLSAAIDLATTDLKGLHLGEHNTPIAAEFRIALDKAKAITQVPSLLVTVDSLRERIDLNEEGGLSLNQLLVGTTKRVKAAWDDALWLWDTLTKEAKRIGPAVEKVDTFEAKDQNRVAELLKRLSIGIVVVTFFFGILRYVANQFRANWQQAVRAEEEDLWLRRFYVGMKSAGSNKEDRSAVIAALVKGIPEVAPSDTKNDDQAQKITLDVLKELLGAISKKL